MHSSYMFSLLFCQECHKPPVIENNVNDPRFVWYCSKCMKNLKKTVVSSSLNNIWLFYGNAFD